MSHRFPHVQPRTQSVDIKGVETTVAIFSSTDLSQLALALASTDDLQGGERALAAQCIWALSTNRKALAVLNTPRLKLSNVSCMQAMHYLIRYRLITHNKKAFSAIAELWGKPIASIKDAVTDYRKAAKLEIDWEVTKAVNFGKVSEIDELIRLDSFFNEKARRYKSRKRKAA